MGYMRYCVFYNTKGGDEMNRHINKMIELICAICLVIVSAYSVYQNFQIKKLKYAIRDFMVVNEIPIEWTVKETKHIEKYCVIDTVPAALIKAIGQSERGLGSQNYGCKKIDLSIMLTMPIDEWQLCQCINIVKHEMYRYCELNNLYFKNDEEMLQYINTHKKHFMFQLANRYCINHAEEWYSNVLTNWLKYERSDKLEQGK